MVLRTSMVMMMMMMMTMMKTLLLLSVLSAVIAESPNDHQLSPELQHPHLLTRLSAAGQQCVVGEIKRALLGIKQLRETLDTQQHTHLQLMETLTHSYNKKRGAEQLAREVEQKLQEAELHCRGNLRSQWAQCRPCLEESCRTFYTSTCRRDDNTFTQQMGEFFRRMASQLDAEEQLYNQNTGENQNAEENQNTGENQNAEENQNTGENHKTQPQPLEAQTVGGVSAEAQTVGGVYAEAQTVGGVSADDRGGGIAADGGAVVDNEGVELQHLSESLNQAKEEAGTLYERCQETVAGMRSVLGPTFQVSFREELQPKPVPPTTLGDVTHSLLEFGRSALQEVESVVQEVSSALQEVESAVQEVGSALTGLFQGLTNNMEDKRKTGGSLCRQLRRQPANCWRLKEQCSSCRHALLTECPAVSQQYSELQEMSLLVNASRQQYSEVQQVVLRHGEHTLLWASHMTAKHAWVTHITNGTTAPKHTFSLNKLTLGGPDPSDGSALEAWQVEACLLNSPPISMSVPSQLEPDDPAFINYVTQEALEVFKRSI